MDIKEILLELLHNKKQQLQEQGYARTLDYLGADRYTSDKDLDLHRTGHEKYQKLSSILESIEEHASIQELSEKIPDWKEVLEELIQEEIKRLQDSDLARSNNIEDKYDSEEELKARSLGYDRFSKLSMFQSRLADLRDPVKKTFFQKLLGKKSEQLFHEDDDIEK